MDRRSFFQQLASGLVVLAAPRLFIPRLIKPAWKLPYRPKGRTIEEFRNDFPKWIFPVISNMAEFDVIDALVSVQPMSAPSNTLMFMDIVSGRGPFLRRYEETFVHEKVGGRFDRVVSPDFCPA